MEPSRVSGRIVAPVTDERRRHEFESNLTRLAIGNSQTSNSQLQTLTPWKLELGGWESTVVSESRSESEE